MLRKIRKHGHRGASPRQRGWGGAETELGATFETPFITYVSDAQGPQAQTSAGVREQPGANDENSLDLLAEAARAVLQPTQHLELSQIPRREPRPEPLPAAAAVAAQGSRLWRQSHSPPKKRRDLRNKMQKNCTSVPNEPEVQWAEMSREESRKDRERVRKRL